MCSRLHEPLHARSRAGANRTGAPLLAPVGLKHGSQTLPKFASIMSAYGLIANRSDALTEPRLEGCPPFRRIEICRFQFTHPQHMRERSRRANNLVDRFAPAGAQQIIGILAL